LFPNPPNPVYWLAYLATTIGDVGVSMTIGLGTNALHSTFRVFFFSAQQAGSSVVVSSTFSTISVVATIVGIYGTNATALTDRSFLGTTATGASTTSTGWIALATNLTSYLAQQDLGASAIF